MPDQTVRELGIVSNCWKVQLDGGQSLDDLIALAVDRGFRSVELRQGCLGEYEADVAGTASSGPARGRLAKLSHRFSSVRFNLAVSLPCFGGDFRTDDPRFGGALSAAVALARGGPPQLRLVDTETRTRELDKSEIIAAGDVIAAMTRTLVEAGGQLSIEHAYQSWAGFWSAIQSARHQLGESARHLRCCFDPCNLLLTEPSESVPAIVDSVTPEDVSMIHLKQRRDGRIQPDVADGDLDWPRLLQSLDRHRHRGPWMFEVAPHAEIWENLRCSAEFLFGTL